MKIELYQGETANEAAQRYFKKAKSAREKREALQKSVSENQAKLIKINATIEREKTSASNSAAAASLAAAAKTKKVERKDRAWFDKFHTFTTSNGFQVLAGKDAKQNERLVADHLEKDDVFFHADIQGAAATVFKTNHATLETLREKNEQDLKEAAQWAASFSSAWKKGLGAVDVYCVTGANVSKYSPGEFVAKGAFMVYGKKDWFRHTLLELSPLKPNTEGKREERLVPSVHANADSKYKITPGDGKRDSIAKMLSKTIGASASEIERFLPGPAALSSEK